MFYGVHITISFQHFNCTTHVLEQYAIYICKNCTILPTYLQSIKYMCDCDMQCVPSIYNIIMKWTYNGQSIFKKGSIDKAKVSHFSLSMSMRWPFKKIATVVKIIYISLFYFCLFDFFFFLLFKSWCWHIAGLLLPSANKDIWRWFVFYTTTFP